MLGPWVIVSVICSERKLRRELYDCIYLVCEGRRSDTIFPFYWVHTILHLDGMGCHEKSSVEEEDMLHPANSPIQVL